MTRELLWLSLPDQRPRRELYWMSRMPGTHVTAMARDEPFGDLTWMPTTYRRPVTRFIEAGAFAWAQGLDEQLERTRPDWVASLELCSLVTGQLSAQRRRRPGLRQAVITWENLPRQPLYALPPYRQAFESTRDADLILCMVDAARDHLALNGFDLSRVRVVKPGIDVELFHPAAELADRPRVVFTSPLAANKGIDTVLDAMRLVRLPYHLSSVTQATALAALDHADEMLAMVDAIKAQRDRIVEAARVAGLTPTPSDANFVLIGGLTDAHATWQALLDRGILVRDVGIAHHLRITAGTPAETDAVIAALTDLAPTHALQEEKA